LRKGGNGVDEIIQIKGMTKTFGAGEAAITALRNIDLTIYKGEIFGIIGLSGAGKSTLVRCINLLEKPTEGTVTVAGQELTTLSERDLRAARQSIGMIFQSFNLLMQKTVLENVCFPLKLQKMPKEEMMARGMELLRVVGLENRAGAYPAQLSGGQKQRVAIARAVANNPQVLLCDEATSALDPNTTRSILELIKEINKAMGVTVVVITHEMKVIEQICHRVAVIDKSQIVELGEVSEVFTSPKSEIARELILPRYEDGATGGAIAQLMGSRVIRVVFNGGTAYEPLIASLAIDCGIKVNILGADTRNLEGKAYGSMLLGLPHDPVQAARAIAYIENRDGVVWEEVSDYNG
jgi:D-methionine transport system ATP-binding protein